MNQVNLPKWIVLQLTEKCNLRCKMCYEWGTHGAYHNKQALAELDFETMKKLIDDCAGSGVRYELFGGEPLMYARIFELITYIKQAGGSVAMPTNGVLLEPYAEKLVDSGVDEVWISLDGPQAINDLQRGNGSYQKAMRGIKRLLDVRNKGGKQKPEVGVTFIVTPLNYHQVLPFFKDLTEKAAVDKLSIELQTFLTEKELGAYETIAKEKFGADNVDIAQGFLASPAEFETIDVYQLAQDLTLVKSECGARGITLNLNPETLDPEEYKKYFSGNWTDMRSQRKMCPCGWLHCEVNAYGDVVICHSFYDIVFGNLNKQRIGDIWNNAKAQEYRKLLKTGELPICPACCRNYL